MKFQMSMGLSAEEVEVVNKLSKVWQCKPAQVFSKVLTEWYQFKEREKEQAIFSASSVIKCVKCEAEYSSKFLECPNCLSVEKSKQME